MRVRRFLMPSTFSGVRPERRRSRRAPAETRAPIAMLAWAAHERRRGSRARIIAICDAYDTMVTARPYDAAATPAHAVAELRRCAGTQFDPELVEPFIQLLLQRLAKSDQRLGAAA
jgi:hypothetical protein